MLRSDQSPNPGLRPKLQSTPPPGTMMPETVPTDVLLQGRSPRHKLESEPVVDHGEPARRQRHTLTKDAGDVLAFG